MRPHSTFKTDLLLRSTLLYNDYRSYIVSGLRCMSEHAVAAAVSAAKIVVAGVSPAIFCCYLPGARA
jgi:hypothetical protein